MFSFMGRSNSCSNNNDISPPNFVRGACSAQQNCNDDKCDDDPCFPRSQQDHGDSACCNEDEEQQDDECQQRKESCLERRKRYSTRARNKCMPFTGHLTEYQEAFRRRNPRAGPRRIYHRAMHGNNERPPWNSSMTVPVKPYQETLMAAEAKLRALDMYMDPTHDVMALAIIREQVKERYRATRNNAGASAGAFGVPYGGGNDCGCETGSALMRGRGGGGYSTSNYQPCFSTKPVTHNLELLEDDISA